MKQVKLMQGDNMESLRKLPDNSIDSVVTDPPYGLSAPKNSGKTSKGGFMNKKWDYDVPTVEFWSEVYRVLKPGGHVLSFGGTRTYHRMAVNIEDAGFEIRDQIQWIYGSGFPKSLNIGKAVDKLNGDEREVVGINGTMNNHRGDGSHMMLSSSGVEVRDREDNIITKGESEFEGWGTALKPANEPICVARKPLSEKSVAENVLKWRTGGINVDGCRVGYRDESDKKSLEAAASLNKKLIYGGNSMNESITIKELNINDEGRFPANLILECICDEVIKGEKGEKTTIQTNINNKEANWFRSAGGDKEERWNFNDKGDIHTNPNCPCRLMDEHSDKGGASRFFYQAKVSKAERNMGLDGFEEKKKWLKGGGGSGISARENVVAKNSHPTVKPINLMSYLCRLITPPGGIVLDPFMGSGSTGISAQLEGFRFVGMEMDEDYFKIAEARIENYEKYKKFLK